MPTGVYSRKKMSKKAKKARNAFFMRRQYANNPALREAQRSLKLQKTYGITAEDYNAFSKFCNDKCVICENPCPSGRRLAVDHDHSNGVIRGLLCINCNKGLGNFKDSIELLEVAIIYLKSYQEALKEHNAITQVAL